MRYLDHDLTEHDVTAEHVILAGGAFETPRLLLRTGLGNPDVVGRFLQFHFQTFALGIFPYRLHGHRGRSVTHLMDDPIVPDELALAAARDAGLPFIRGGIVEHGAAGHPMQEAIYSPSRSGRTPRTMLDSPMRDRMAAFTMQGEDLPQATNRIELDPPREGRVRHAGRPRHLLAARHEIVCAQHWAPRLEAVMKDAGCGAHVLGHVAADPGITRRQARLARADLAPHHGRRPDGRRSRRRACSTAGSACTAWRTCSAPTRRCSRPRRATARR